MTHITKECGTHAGHQRHTNRGEIPCQLCADANKEYHKARNTDAKELKRLKAEDRLIAQMYVMERLAIARKREREKYATQVQESA